MIKTPLQEITSRIRRFQKNLQDREVDGAIIVQNVDVLYFTGTIQKAHLYVPATGEPVLLVSRNMERARLESPLQNIVQLDNIKNIPVVLQELGYNLGSKLALELDVLPVNTYQFYQKIFAGFQLVDGSTDIKRVRMVKSAYEIQLLKEAAQLMDKVYQRVPNIVREGMPEIEVAAQIEAAARTLGHHGLARLRSFNQELVYGHLLSGVSGDKASYFDGPTGGPGLSPAFSQGAGWKKIARNEPISLDYTGNLYGYHIDFTRLFVLGNLDDELQKAFDCALRIQNKIIESFRPGVPCSFLYQQAMEMAEAEGLLPYFMGPQSNQVKFLGHGVGLELDEMPILAKNIDLPLEVGMTVAIEPKFVFPGKGVVGIENTWAVTEGEPEKITNTPDEIVFI